MTKDSTSTPRTPQKVVYLFGAGATHAELANLEADSYSEVFTKRKGLLMSHVSDRIMARVQNDRRYLKHIEMVSSPKGSLNIELLISLIENSRIPGATTKTRRLKNLVTKDISRILTRSRLDRFYLHKALLELHERIQAKEKVLGLISLNYDGILDEAYKAVHNDKPNYYFLSNDQNRIPLLKLHGSFNWKNVKLRGRRRQFEIIPLGVNKYYLHLPYNLIWSRALEILIECDILRVVGCSLSPNDTHLVDLLFKAHLEKGAPFEIQIVNDEPSGKTIKNNYGFFPRIQTLTDIEEPLIPDEVRNDIGNAFKTWLKYKGLKMLEEAEVKTTRYLKRATV